MRPAVYLLVLLLPLWGCEVQAGSPTDAAMGDGAVDAGSPTPDAGPPEDIDGFIQHEMEAHGIAGMAASITREGEVLWQGTFGYADIEAERPVTDQTLFAVASISKTLVTALLMRLVEQDLLDLDAPLEDYLDFPVRHPDFPDIPITTRMLVAHTSGLEDDFPTLASVMGPGLPPMTLAEFSEQYVTPGSEIYTEQNWGEQPGTWWSYCNAAYGIVGHVVEVVGGDTVPAQTEAAVFGPLGMDDSTWFYTEADPDLLAVGYTWNGRSYTALDYETQAFYPASSFITSLDELSVFLRAFIGLGEVDGTRILEEDTVRAMREPPFPDVYDAQALTWRYRTLGGRTYLGHSGATLGGSANMLFRPDDGTAIIMLTNSDAYVLDRLGISEGADALRRILRRIHDESETL